MEVKYRIYKKRYRYLFYLDERGYVHNLAVPLTASQEVLERMTKEYGIGEVFHDAVYTRKYFVPAVGMEVTPIGLIKNKKF